MVKKKIKVSDILGDSYYVYELSSSNYTPALNGTITITCTMKDVYGTAAGNKSITLYQNGTSKGAQTTNSSGVATWSITCSTAGIQSFSIKDTSIEVFVDNKEDTSNKVTSLSSSSTDTQYPSAKIVYDSLQNLRTEFITGTFANINGNVILANTSETTPTNGDRFYIHITNISVSTTDAIISVNYNNQSNAYGTVYKNGTALKPNVLKADTILLIELVFNNGYSWNIIEAFDGDITKEQYPIKETLKTKLGDERAYVVSEVIHSDKKALCKITNVSSYELSLNENIYIKIPSYQTDSDSATYIQLSDMDGSMGISMRNTNNQTINESDINGKIIYATYGGSQFTVSNIYSTNRLMALISELPTKTSDLQNDSGFEDTSNKVTSLSSSSTDTQYPSAKCVYDTVDIVDDKVSVVYNTVSIIDTSDSVYDADRWTEYGTMSIGQQSNRKFIAGGGTGHVIYDGNISNLDNYDITLNLTPSKTNTHVYINDNDIGTLPTSQTSILFKKRDGVVKVVYDNNQYDASSVQIRSFNVLNRITYTIDVVLYQGMIYDVIDSIPSKTSDLTNDSNFLTSHQSLTNYVQKSSTAGLLKNDGTVMESGTGASNFALGNHTHNYASSSHNHNISDLNNTATVEVVVTYTDNTTETLTLLKYIGS